MKKREINSIKYIFSKRRKSQTWRQRKRIRQEKYVEK